MPSQPTAALWNRGMTIPEGNTAILTIDMLGFTEVSSTRQDQLTYQVLRPPKLGYLGLNNETSRSVIMPTVVFTQADLEADRLFYAQTIKTTEYSDSFEFQLLNNVGTQLVPSSRFDIRIEKRAIALPTLDVNVPLTVIHGYKALLMSTNLHTTSSDDISPSNLIYTVIESPRHGQIWKSGVVTSSFTQSDIDAGMIEYKSDSSDESMMDYFLFTVSTTDRNGNLVNSTVSQKPLFFSILIQPTTKIPPTVVQVESPVNLIPLGSERFGFLFSSVNLRATHPLFDSRDVIYQLKTKPQHGYLEHLGSRRPIKRKFSQKDIDDQRIAFVLNEGITATSDNFTFRILDLNRNSIDGLRLQLDWSLIEFSQSQYVVCEDVHLLAVSIVRTGAINQSSAINVRVKSMSAKEKLDFIVTSNSSVEFPPGVSEVKWTVEIVNDAIKEGNDEKFKIVLENATNAILGNIDKTQIHLIDYDNGNCMEYIGMITRHNEQSQPDSELLQAGPQPKTSSTHRKKRPMKASGDLLPLAPPTGEDDADYEQYPDHLDDDDISSPSSVSSSSSILNSDLAFYMPPDVANGQSVAAVGSAMDSKRNKPRTGNHGNTASVKQPVKNARRNAAKNSRNVEVIKSQSIPQPCTRDTQGLLYFDLDSSKMFKCMDRQWQHWGWGLTGATAAPVVVKQPNSVRRAAAMRESSPVDGLETSEPCPPGWSLVDGEVCCLVLAERLSWKSASQKCQSHDAYLTRVDSKRQLNQLWTLTGGQHFWTGLHLEATDSSRQWRNADRTVPRYFNWRVGSPCTSRDCLTMSTHLPTTAAGAGRDLCVAIRTRQQMVDLPCGESMRLKSICAKSAVKMVSRRRRISNHRRS
jgi:hypothetical protein